MTKETMLRDVTEGLGLIDAAVSRCMQLANDAETPERGAAFNAAGDVFNKVSIACQRLQNRLTCSAAILEALGEAPTMDVDSQYAELEEATGFANSRLEGLLVA